MELLEWIDKPISEVKDSLLYGKYFDSILLENAGDICFLLNAQLGVDVIFRDDLSIKAIHFYSGKQTGVNQFTDKLPLGLSFGNSRNQARSVLGDPLETGGGSHSVLYGTASPWDKYIYENFSLQLQFSENNDRIHLITIDSLK